MNLGWIAAAGAAAAAFFLGGNEAMAAVNSEGAKRFRFWSTFDAMFKAAGARYGVDWKWLKSTAIVESSLGQNSRVIAGETSSDGKSWGLMQFTLPTARDLRPGTSIADLNVPEISIDLAGKYLAQLKARFPGDVRKAIISYNQGPGNTAKGKDFTGDYWAKWSAALALVSKG